MTPHEVSFFRDGPNTSRVSIEYMLFSFFNPASFGSRFSGTVGTDHSAYMHAIEAMVPRTVLSRISC